ncbi:MAG: SRPBCC family protein [Solirubrobacterales bacterium]
MKFTDEFSVPAPREEVWPALLDLERVAPCLPGASLTGPSGDGYAGLMKVKLGPLLSSYKGTVEIKSSDQDSGLVVIRARGKDTTGQGVVEAMINATVSGNGAETLVAVETDMKVTGPAAQFGRGVMEQVSAKMLADFAGRLADEIGGNEEEVEKEKEAAETPGEEPAAGPAPPTPADGPDARTEAPPFAAEDPSEDGYLDLGEFGRAALAQALAKHAPAIVAGLVLLIVAFLLGRRSARRTEAAPGTTPAPAAAPTPPPSA